MPYTWKVKSENLTRASFEDYVKDFSHIYYKTDAKRDVTDVLINLIAKTSALSESARRKMYSRVVGDLADVIAWLFSLAAKFQADLKGEDRIFGVHFIISESLFEKYPGVCPVCLSRRIQNEGTVKSPGKDRKPVKDLLRHSELTEDQVEQVANSITYSGASEPCRCLISSEDPEFRKDNMAEEERVRLQRNLDRIRIRFSEKRRDINQRPQTLSEYEIMFHEIYGNNIRVISIEDIVFHLQEELGELADALKDLYTYNTKETPNPARKDRDDRVHRLSEEFADVISWLFSLVFKIRLYIRTFAKNANLIAKAAGVQTINRHVKSFSEWLLRNEVSIHSIIWQKYGTRQLGHIHCGDLCKEEVCKCPWIIARTEELVTEILDN